MIGAVLAAALAVPMFPAAQAEERLESYGFEEGEQEWFTGSSDGRISQGYDELRK